jgi:hypothetical protein
VERGAGALRTGVRTGEHWRGETLRMGLLYEAAAVEFWSGIVTKIDPPDPAD